MKMMITLDNVVSVIVELKVTARYFSFFFSFFLCHSFLIKSAFKNIKANKGVQSVPLGIPADS
jgi:hypothetical protein